MVSNGLFRFFTFLALAVIFGSKSVTAACENPTTDQILTITECVAEILSQPAKYSQIFWKLFIEVYLKDVKDPIPEIISKAYECIAIGLGAPGFFTVYLPRYVEFGFITSKNRTENGDTRYIYYQQRRENGLTTYAESLGEPMPDCINKIFKPYGSVDGVRKRMKELGYPIKFRDAVAKCIEDAQTASSM